MTENKKIKFWIVGIFTLVAAISVGVVWLCSPPSNAVGHPELIYIPADKKPRNTDKRIARAKAELEKIKESRSKDGKPGKLKLTDVLKPEVVLPPTLALLEDELVYYEINRAELTEQIRKDPKKFRIAVPEHWRKRFLILTPAHEKLVGDKFDAELASKGKIYHDDAEMKRVRPIAEKIAAQLPEPVPVRIFLYRDDTINAFCLPNGSIYIHSALLKKITDDDELAFVIAHEYAHFAARHGNEGVTKFIFLMAGDVLAENKAGKIQGKGKAVKGFLLRGSYLGGGYVGALLPFRRKMESEADTLGIRYMARAGYDPQGALSFFQRMKSANPEDPGWAKLLSTHPTDEKRLKRMQKECQKLKSKGEPNGDNYCPGVFTDIENYKNFLCSPLGGGWRFDKYSDVCSEIKIFPSPKRNILLPYLDRLKSYDYIIIAFCGHGGYSRIYRQTIIQINGHEYVRESELYGIGLRENLVLDCCRVLLPDIVTDAMEHFCLRKASARHRELNLVECRKYYEKSTSECRTGCNVLYGCSVGESSGESKSSGGYYSSSLFRVARDWEREKNETLPPDKYSVLRIPCAHSQAVPLVKKKKADQTPQISSNSIDFPWAIAVY